MAYVANEMGMMVNFKPEEAKKKILGALKDECGANADIAAAHFGVTRRTFGRWVKALDLTEAASKMRATAKRKGWWKATPPAEA